MKAKDLRLNNKIVFGIKEVDVRYYDIENLAKMEHRQEDSSAYKPVPITEEKLEKLGFEKKDEYSYRLPLPQTKSHLQINIYVDVYLLAIVSEYGAEITVGECKHVHQIQNIYHALENNEITY